MSVASPSTPIRALDRWGPALAIFPPDVAAVLGRMAERLKTALGHPAPAAQRRGAPEGYDGLTRRGSLENLLLSEWALLDAAPDELIRRASQGELSYLRRAHAAPHSDALTLVLFDVGPEQLGAPRLAHLALLVVLAERARRRRSHLVFGTLQGEVSERHDALGPTEVEALLSRRSNRVASSEDLARWQGAMRSERGAPALDERFIVGASFLDRASVQLAIEEPLHATDALVVRVRSPGSPPREVLLELPPPRDALRILRDPFARPATGTVMTAASPSIDPATAPVFSADGRKLFLRAGAHALTQIAVPNSPRNVVGPALELRFPDGHVPIAVGRHRSNRKRSVAVSQSVDGLYAHDVSKRGNVAVGRLLALTDEVTLPEPPRALGVLLWRDGSTRWVLHGNGALLAVRGNEVVERRDITALAASDGSLGLSCLRALPNGEVVHVMATTDGKIAERRIGLAAGHHHRLFGGSLPYPCAVGYSPTSYRHFTSATERTELTVSMADRAVAVTRAGIVVLDRTHMQVALTHRTGREVLFTTSQPVTSVTLSPSGEVLCAVTDGGEVVLQRDAQVLSRHLYPVIR